MTREQQLLTGLLESWGSKGFNVSTDSSLPSSGITINNPSGSGRALLLNFVTPLAPTFQSGTYAEWLAAAAAGELPAGQWVKATDKCDLGLILFCASSSEFSTFGIGGYLNADFQGEGNYSNISGFGTAQGLWSASNEGSYSDNDACVWDQKNYLVVDAAAVDGNSPNVNTTAYEELSASVGNGYIAAYDAVMVYVPAGILTMRSDNLGNVVQLVGNPTFDWGNQNVKNNVLDCEGTITISNVSGKVAGSIIGNANDVVFSASGVSGKFYYNIECGENISVSADNNQGTILLSSVGNLPTCQLNDNTGEMDIQASGSTIINANFNSGTLSIVCDQSEIITNANTGTIIVQAKFGSEIDLSANTAGTINVSSGVNSVVNGTNNGGEISLTAGDESTSSINDNPSGSVVKAFVGNFGTLTAPSLVNADSRIVNVGNGSTLNISSAESGCEIIVGDNVSVTDTGFDERHKYSMFLDADLSPYVNTLLEGKIANDLGSNFETSVDMDGTTTLTLPNDFVGIVYLTGTGAIALNSIVANQKFPFQIQPTNQSLTVTFGQGSSAIRNSAASEVLDYTKGDCLVVQKNNDGVGAFQALGVYVNL